MEIGGVSIERQDVGIALSTIRSGDWVEWVGNANGVTVYRPTPSGGSKDGVALHDAVANEEVTVALKMMRVSEDD